MKLDQAYWEKRYQTAQTGWDIGYVSTPLKEYFDQLTSRDLRILIPGAGNAYEAEYLHQNGFSNVYVVDVARDALENLKERCPDFPAEHLLLKDFFELTGQFDLIVEQTFFCALWPHLRLQYAYQCHRLLRSGGKLMGLLFDDPLFSDHPPFGGSLEEYRDYFMPYFDFKVFERATNSIKPRANREVFMVLERK